MCCSCRFLCLHLEPSSSQGSCRWCKMETVLLFIMWSRRLVLFFSCFGSLCCCRTNLWPASLSSSVVFFSPFWLKRTVLPPAAQTGPNNASEGVVTQYVPLCRHKFVSHQKERVCVYFQGFIYFHWIVVSKRRCIFYEIHMDIQFIAQVIGSSSFIWKYKQSHVLLLLRLLSSSSNAVVVWIKRRTHTKGQLLCRLHLRLQMFIEGSFPLSVPFPHLFRRTKSRLSLSVCSISPYLSHLPPDEMHTCSSGRIETRWKPTAASTDGWMERGVEEACTAHQDMF